MPYVANWIMWRSPRRVHADSPKGAPESVGEDGLRHISRRGLQRPRLSGGATRGLRRMELASELAMPASRLAWTSEEEFGPGSEWRLPAGTSTAGMGDLASRAAWPRALRLPAPARVGRPCRFDVVAGHRQRLRGGRCGYSRCDCSVEIAVTPQGARDRGRARSSLARSSRQYPSRGNLGAKCSTEARRGTASANGGVQARPGNASRVCEGEAL